MLSIRPVTPDDYVNVSVLLASVFGQANEAQLVAALRDTGAVAIELVAEDEAGLVSHVCLSRLEAPQDWLALAPVSTRIEQQGRGFGSELIRYALDAARQAHWQAVVVVGGPDYYQRFGFVFDGPARLTSPYPAQFTGLYPIAPGTAQASARLVYPQPFAEV